MTVRHQFVLRPNIISFCIISACYLAIAGCAAAFKPNVTAEPIALQSGEYALDKEHAALVFKVGHLGFSKFIGRFENFDVALDFDEQNPQDARVEAVIDMTSLDIANDSFAAQLMGPGWFDAEQFPQAVFRSTQIEITGDNTGRMTGELTLRGVTHPVAMDVIFNGGARDNIRRAYVIGLSAQGAFSRKAFGVDRYSLFVGDAVELEIEAEFMKK
ncbi:MAG: YceI family protein [Pseudomonadota bacterium]